MDFKKKLRVRLYLAVSYIVIGIALIVLGLLGVITNEFISSYGLALAVMGVARIKQYMRITKSEESINRRRIAESDERNVSIMLKAKNMAFSISIMLMAIAVIVCEIIGLKEWAYIMALTVCGMTLVYWISYYIIRRKN